jgi:hypothetical protein
MRNLAVAAAITLLASHGVVWGHESHGGMIYPAWCCNGTATTGDCQEIPTRTVKAIMGGFRVTLRPGDHRLVTKEHVFDIPQKEALPSSDGQYHICLYPNEDHRQCFMAPPPGA